MNEMDEEKFTVVALFYRDIIRCFKFHDFKGILQWLFNYKNYWRFIPTYDKVLFKQILKELLVNKTKKRFLELFKIKGRN